jgi:hypothetical protein
VSAEEAAEWLSGSETLPLRTWRCEKRAVFNTEG